MEINTLVRHKKKPDIGIGCIAKIHKNNFSVNFGTYDVLKVSAENLIEIDTSKCKTITAHEYQKRIISDSSTLNDAIVGNELKHYVGIGWITTRVITETDLLKYPRVV